MGKSAKPWHSAASCSLEDNDALLEAGEDYLPNSSFYVTTTRSGQPALARNKNDQLLRGHGFDLLGQSFGIPSRIDYERGNHGETRPPRGTTGHAAPGLPRRHRKLLLEDAAVPDKEDRTSCRHQVASTSASAKTPRSVPGAHSIATAGLIHSETYKPPRRANTPSKVPLSCQERILAENYVSNGGGGNEAMLSGNIYPPVQHYLPSAPPAPPQSLHSHHSIYLSPFVPPYATRVMSHACPVQGHPAMPGYAIPQPGSLHPIPHQQASLAPIPKSHSAFLSGLVIPPPPPPPLLPLSPAGPADAARGTATESRKARTNDEPKKPSKGNTRTTGGSGQANKRQTLVYKEDQKRTSAEVLSEADLFEHKHVCAACGKPRSRGYHMTHLVKRGEHPEPGYCRRCVAHADYTDSETSIRDTGRSLSFKNLPSSGLSTDEDFLISSGRYVHDERSRRYKLHRKPRRSSFLKGFLPSSVRSKNSVRAPGSLSSAEDASSRASSLAQDHEAHSKISLRRAARKRKAADSRARRQLETQAQEISGKTSVEPFTPTEISKSPMLAKVTVPQHPASALPACTQERVPDSPGYQKPTVRDDDPQHGLRDAATDSVKGDGRFKEPSRQQNSGYSTCHTSPTSGRSAESRVQNDSRAWDTKGDTAKHAGSTSNHKEQKTHYLAEASRKKDVNTTFDSMPPTPVDWVPVDYGAQPRVVDGDGAWEDDLSEAEEMAAMLAEEELLRAESCSSDEERTDGNGHYKMAEADGSDTEGLEEAGVFDSRKCQPKQLEFSSHDERASTTSSCRKRLHGRHKGGAEWRTLVPLATGTAASSSMRSWEKCEGHSSLSSHSSDFQPPGEESSVLVHTGHSMEDISHSRNTVHDTVMTNERGPLRGLRRLGGFFRSP